MEKTHQRRRWAIAGAAAVLVFALVSRVRLNPWLFAALLLSAWISLTYGLSPAWFRRPARILLSATALVLTFVLWNYTALQPRIRLESVELRRLPSSVQPGLVELVVRNSGTVPARIVAVSAAHLTPLFRNAHELASANVEADLTERLKRASATEPTVVAPGAIARVAVDVPFSERVWHFGRGDVTLLVTAQIRYRDRVFHRQTVFCQSMNPRAAQWVSCPFLND